MKPPNLRVHLWAVGACRGPGAIAARGSVGWWGRRQRFPALVAALGHPDHGWTLFDTGYDGRYFDVTRAWPHRLHRWVLPVSLPAEERLERQMADAGLRPGDVRRVIVSHFHLDHIAGLHRFPGAEVIFAAAAWGAVRGLSSWRAARAVFHPDLVNGEQLETRGRALRTGDAVPWAGFAETWDLFGDDSLRLVALPGHAPGQLGAVFRREPDGRPVFLVADALWTRDNLRGHPPHGLANLLLHDRPAFDDTLGCLRRFAAAHPDALLVPSHCAATLAAWAPADNSPDLPA